MAELDLDEAFARLAREVDAAVPAPAVAHIARRGQRRRTRRRVALAAPVAGAVIAGAVAGSLTLTGGRGRAPETVRYADTAAPTGTPSGPSPTASASSEAPLHTGPVTAAMLLDLSDPLPTGDWWGTRWGAGPPASAQPFGPNTAGLLFCGQTIGVDTAASAALERTFAPPSSGSELQEYVIRYPSVPAARAALHRIDGWATTSCPTPYSATLALTRAGGSDAGDGGTLYVHDGSTGGLPYVAADARSANDVVVLVGSRQGPPRVPAVAVTALDTTLHAAVAKLGSAAATPTQRTAPTATASPVPPTGPTATFGSWTGVEPSLIYFSGDSGNIVHDIAWSSWDERSAAGHGTWGYDDCTPNCAQGTVTDYPATVTLSAPSGGRFTRVTEVQSGPHRRTYTWTLPNAALGARS